MEDNSWQVLQTWRDVEASSPLSDLGVLLLPQLLSVVQHHRGALVRHAKLVGVAQTYWSPLVLARVSTPGCMTAWQSEVGVQIADRVNHSDGTLLTPHVALPCSPSDRCLMSGVLQNFVCTPMAKPTDTLVFQRIKVCINDLVSDLDDPQGTYEMVDEHVDG